MIKQVGNTQINPLHRLTCHCGKVELELTLPNGIEKPRRDCGFSPFEWYSYRSR